MRIAKLLLVNLAVFAAGLTALEGFSSLVIVAGRRIEKHAALRPSKNDEYLSLPMYATRGDARAYWEEFRQSTQHTYVDYLGWQRVDFAGRYINVVDGRRVTANDGPAGGPILAVFGGSGIWGTGVADAETIPSWIARRLAGAMRVENFGEAGYVSFQNYLQLQRALLDHQPIVHAIFYEGVNDAHASCVNPARDGATLEFNRMKEKIEYRRGSDLRLVDAARILGDYVRTEGASAAGGYRCDDEAEASRAAEAMVRTWKLIDELAASVGTRADFFLQPVSYAGSSNVSYLHVDPAPRRSFQNFYTSVARHVRALGVTGYHDVSGLFSDSKAAYYIDFAHVTGEGNRLVANAMVDAIQPR